MGRLSLFLISLLISGCGTATIVKCPKPAKPTYSEMNETAGWTLENIEALINNALSAKQYADGLEITVDCYEKQSE